MRKISIRWRLTAWYGVVLAAALGVFSALIWLSLRQRLVRDVEQDLTASAARFQSFFSREIAESQSSDQVKDELGEFCQGLPASDYLEITGPDGFEFHYPSGGRAAGSHTRTITIRFAVDTHQYLLSATASLAPTDRTLELLGWLLVSLVPFAIGIACVGGGWLARRAMKPVDEITTAASQISIDNLSMRLPVPPTGDELQRLTEVWNSMLQRLERAVKTLTQFAADASHELRTPLAVIRTSAELALRRARSPESYKASIREIAEEAERMTQLVEDLLFIARNESRGAEMPMRSLDLAAILAETVEELADVAETRGCRIELQHGAAPPVMVSGNQPALRRLFLVLLDNAVKYSPAGSKVMTGVAKSGGGVVVTVKDFGIGIDARELPHIFKRFYQADESRSDGGFGLGLALADSIARAHGASIEVESAPGTGSIFRVAFPASGVLSETPFVARETLVRT